MKCSWYTFVHTPLGCAAESRCAGLLSAGYVIACHFEKTRFDSRHNSTCIRVVLRGQQVFMRGCEIECMSFRWFKFAYSDRSDVTCALRGGAHHGLGLLLPKVQLPLPGIPPVCLDVGLQRQAVGGVCMRRPLW